jgi:spore coat protein U-like protein
MRKLMLFVASLGFAGAATAGTSTSPMAVSATVSSTCAISAGSMAFGAYDPVAATQVDGSATVSVNCTKGAAAKITLGQGQNAGGGSTDAIPARRMTDGSSFLTYALFSDASRTTVWANTAATGVTYNAASSAQQQITVYGRITASQDIPAGSYTDSVVATITF